MYLRHVQINLAIESGRINLDRKWNILSTFLGIVACIGMLTVANFQETSVLIVHLTGALAVFVIGTFYFIVQVR